MADTFPVSVVEPSVAPTEPAVEPRQLPYLTYDKEEFETDVGLFGGDTSAFTSSMVEVLAEDYPDDPEYISYPGLKDGSSLVFNDIPELADLSPAERRLTDNDIIEFFARDLDGDPIQAGTMLRGAMREAIPAAASLPTFMGGYATGNYLVSAVPPIGPGAVLRFGVPLITGMGASALGYMLGEKVNTAIQGEESPILPGTSAAYEAGKTAAGAAAWLPMPYMVPKKLNFGIELAEALVKDNKKVPFSLKLARGLDSSVGKMGEAAWANPYKFGAIEALAGAGSTAGAYGAENAFEGEALPRIAGEMIGGVTVPLAVNVIGKRLVKSISLIPASYRAVKDGTAYEGMVSAVSMFKGQRQTAVTNFILDKLEAGGEDPEAVIAALTSKEFESLLVDEQGKPIAITSAMKSASPVLAAIEKSLEITGTGLSKERVSAEKLANRAIRNSILALYVSGDKDAIQEGALLAQAAFDADLSEGMESSIQGVLQNFEQVAGKRGGSEWAGQRQAVLGQKLFEVIDMRFKAARAQERTLWRNTGDSNRVITEFVDFDGNTSDKPNFMSFWENTIPTTEEAATEVTKNMPALEKFFQRKRNELFPDAEDAAEIIASPRLRKAREKFEDIFDSLGTQNRDQVNSTRAQAENIADLDERIVFLREQASLVRRSAVDFEDRRLEMRTANALDELANVQRLTSRDAARESALSQTEQASDGGLTVQEIVDMRSTALNLGRTLASNGNADGSRVAYGFAEALLQDLNSIPEGQNPAYQTARAYSRALNDAFTRTFAGEVLGVKTTGAPRIPPEQMANDIFNGDAGYVRSKQLDGIGRFELTTGLTTLAGNARGELKPILDDMMASVINPDNDMIDTTKLSSWFTENSSVLDAFPKAKENVLAALNTTTTVRGTTEAILRNIRAAIGFDATTGEVNVRSLRNWMAKPENADVLNAMPSLKADLENSATANLLLKENKEWAVKRKKELQNEISFMDLLPTTTENPSTAFHRALTNSKFNKTPITNMTRLWSVVENAPESWTDSTGVVRTREEAREGFKSALLQNFYSDAGSESQAYSAKALFDAVFVPHKNSRNNITLAEWMVEKGVMPEAEVNRLKTITEKMLQMESFVMGGNIDLDDLSSTIGPIADFWTRVSGSQAGAQASSLFGGSGNDLIARGAGSKGFRTAYSKLFQQIPSDLKADVMTKMMENPEFAATMLKKGRTEREKGAIASRLKKYLIEYGFIPAVRETTNLGRRTIPSVIREESDGDLDQTAPTLRPFFIQNVLPSNDQQGAVAPPPRPPVQQRPSPVVPPTTQASAVPSPAPAPASSGPVDRTRYAALFPNDSISGMMKTTQQMSRGGIASLMR